VIICQTTRCNVTCAPQFLVVTAARFGSGGCQVSGTIGLLVRTLPGAGFAGMALVPGGESRRIEVLASHANEYLRERLPEPALTTILRMIAEEENLSQSFQGIFSQQSRARGLLQKAKAHLAYLQTLNPLHPDFWRSGDTSWRLAPPSADRDEQIIQNRERVLGIARRERDDAEAEVSRLDARADEITQKKSPVAARCVSFIRNVPPHIPITLHDRRAKAPSGDLRRVVSELREKRQGLIAERAQIEAAVYPSSVTKQIMRREVDRLAELGRPDCLRTVELKLPPHFSTTQVLDAAGLPMPLQKYADGVALMAWMFKSELIDRLSIEIDELSNDAESLDDRDRTARDAALAAAILQTEREEEAAIELGEQTGVIIRRRDDMNPVAVLGLADDLNGRIT
jgi:hypothetical protein